MMWNVLIDRKGVNRIQTELLLRKAQSGDTGALDTLITAYYPQILNYCRWHTADEQQAQDAAQETFLKAVRWLDSCGGFQGAFRPFLYKIAKNICIDLNRTMKRTEVSLESLPDEPAYQESGFAAAEEKANLRAQGAVPRGVGGGKGPLHRPGNRRQRDPHRGRDPGRHQRRRDLHGYLGLHG